ncbi:MAG: AAA family ATPase [Candidatus Binatia bacterium]
MRKLTKLELHGFKSIRHLADFKLGPLNILIGVNGAGKSNLISFFKLINWMTPSPGNLQFYIGKSGGANVLLHDGVATTPQLEAILTFETDAGVNEYSMRLFHAAPDTLIFADEKYRFSRHTSGGKADWKLLGAGHREARLVEVAEEGDQTAKTILWLMKGCVVYQFHNTSDTARIRQRWDVEDNRFLKEDAANLAPFLLRLRDTQPKAYSRIVETLRQIAPFFADFVLEPLGDTVILQWRERNSDIIFGPHQASDGTLRVMALVSLLLQPEEDLPTVVILDEPELGLHPYAIHVVAGLLKSIATRTQVILATQSMTFVDCFEPEHIIVVSRPGRESTFKRLDSERLKEWLEEYSLAELWEKNVLGGRPAS